MGLGDTEVCGLWVQTLAVVTFRAWTSLLRAEVCRAQNIPKPQIPFSLHRHSRRLRPSSLRRDVSNPPKAETLDLETDGGIGFGVHLYSPRY